MLMYQSYRIEILRRSCPCCCHRHHRRLSFFFPIQRTILSSNRCRTHQRTPHYRMPGIVFHQIRYDMPRVTLTLISYLMSRSSIIPLLIIDAAF